MEKYYRILGLRPGASVEEVKKAYRKMALQHHPDLQSGNEERFKKIVEAYEMINSFSESQQKRRQMGPEELERFYELLKKAAQEKAREKAFANAAKVRARKREEQERSYRQAIYSFFGLALILIFSYKAYYWVLDWQISRNPMEVVAEVSGIERNRVVFEFPSGDSLVESRQYVRGASLRMYSAAGMPLKVGDQFRLFFRKDDPDYHRLDTYSISSKTFNRYIDITAKALIQFHFEQLDYASTELKNSEARCLALLVYEKYGLEGLVKCYHFDTHPLERFSTNSWTWHFFWNSDEMKEIRKACSMGK